ncbi:unnamed protein product [Heterobilharzia americana]|nr:unnamed protein product [Heterobilharzia americana]
MNECYRYKEVNQEIQTVSQHYNYNNSVCLAFELYFVLRNPTCNVSNAICLSADHCFSTITLSRFVDHLLVFVLCEILNGELRIYGRVCKIVCLFV